MVLCFSHFVKEVKLVKLPLFLCHGWLTQMLSVHSSHRHNAYMEVGSSGFCTHSRFILLYSILNRFLLEHLPFLYHERPGELS